MLPEQDILDEILEFFSDKFEVKTNRRGFKYAAYKKSWLNKIGLNENSQDESKTKQTVKKLQEHILHQFGAKRIKIEANVDENMTLRFKGEEFVEAFEKSNITFQDIVSEYNRSKTQEKDVKTISKGNKK